MTATNSTGKKIRDCGAKGKKGSNDTALYTSNRYLEFKNLLMNSVKISDLGYIEETFVKSTLIENGSVGYDAMNKVWAKVEGNGTLNEYGNPTVLKFNFKNGKSYSRPAFYEPNIDGAYRIKAFPDTFAMSSLIRESTDIIEQCDKTILQNIQAVKQPIILQCQDEDMKLSVESLFDSIINGKPGVIVNGNLGDALKLIDLKVPFIALQVAEYRDLEKNELLNKLGVMTANTSKRERVQSAEVNATIGQCVDYSYLLIDTFNKQMDTYGLPFRMDFNASLEDLYTPGSIEEDIDNLNKEGISND